MDVRIDLTSSDMDPYLELQTSGGTTIAANDDFGSLNSAIIMPLAPGRYIIQARALSGGQGSYRLSLREGPDCSPLGDLELGRTEEGALTGDSCFWEWGGHADNWSLTVDAEANLRITARSADFDEVVLLKDAHGNIVNGADEHGPAGYARLDMRVPRGDWTITVGALTPGRLGDYELTVDLTPPCTPGTTLVLGQTESGAIGPDDCLFEGFAPADSFALVLDEETPLDLHMKSSDLRPLIIVRDAEGRDVTFADDPTGGGSARAQVTLEAGSYAVYALTVDHPPAGTYQLTVSEISCADPTPVTFGSTASGTLGDDDCLRSNGAWQERWELELAADESVRIDMTSNEVDAYLVLKDSLGNVVTVDDDGGEGVNARIDAELTAGRYGIVASSFAPGQAGSYTLTVGAPPSPALSMPGPSAEADGVSAKQAPSGRPAELWRHLNRGRAEVTPRWLVKPR